MSLGARLRQHIAMNRLTVKAFSERCGIPYRTLYDYLGGGRKPGADHLAAMSRAGVNVEWLLTGSQRPHLAFDLSQWADMPPLEGIVLADQELAGVLMRSALDRVERHVVEHPEIVARIGLGGIVASIWALFTAYAAAVDTFSDRFEHARRDGWDVDRLASMVTDPLNKTELELVG